MSDIIVNPVDDTVDPVIIEALNGVPNFLDIPDELRQEIEKATVGAERLFWLRSSHIEKTPVVETILRRAFYAEARAYEMEMRLAEISLVASGLKDEIERLQDEITVISGHTG